MTSSPRRPILPPWTYDTHPESSWLFSPSASSSPPPLLWSLDPSGELIEIHETPMGACLLTSKSLEFSDWRSRRNALYPRDTPSSSSSVTNEDAAPSHTIVIKSEPSEVAKDEDSPESPWQWRNVRQRSLGRKRRVSFQWECGMKLRLVVRKGKVKEECQANGVRVDRWSAERYSKAEWKMVAIMRELGAELGRPVMRHKLRHEARRHIGDTGLLDHLLKHMAGKVVADGRERFQRRHNPAGDLEYWLEPADMEEIRRKAGVPDPYWAPPPGWRLGDSIYQTVCGGECKKETIRLKSEVVALKRVKHDLLQLKSKMEHQAENEVVAGVPETMLGASRLSPSTVMPDWGVRRKTNLAIRQHRDMSLFGIDVEEPQKQQIRKKNLPGVKKMSERVKRGQKNSMLDMKEKGWKSSDEDELESQVIRVHKSDRWSSDRYKTAVMKLVDVMQKMGADLEKPVVRQELREVMRKHIGDTGLLDHLLKHMAGKVVLGGTNRLQRQHNTEGAMVYWLEPAEFAELRLKARVADPYWAPPPGWQLGDSTTSWPCSANCKKEMNRLIGEIAALKRDVERLRALQPMEKHINYIEPEAGWLISSIWAIDLGSTTLLMACNFIDETLICNAVFHLNAIISHLTCYFSNLNAVTIDSPLPTHLRAKIVSISFCPMSTCLYLQTELDTIVQPTASIH